MEKLIAELKKHSMSGRAEVSKRFFKTGKGEYGEGDIFLGVSVPDTRTIARKFGNIELHEAEKLIHSKIHEERLCGLLILVEKFQKADEKGKKEIYDFYMKNMAGVNNWDLVDLTADKIVGEYLFGKDKKILYELAKSENVWGRRIAIVSTFAFIKKGKHKDTFNISEILLRDKHDLIQKAVGWMLREVGKRIGNGVEEQFLKKYYKEMPRTMLRYAIERFSEKKRRAYIQGII